MNYTLWLYNLVHIETSSGQNGPKTTNNSNRPAAPSILDPSHAISSQRPKCTYLALAGANTSETVRNQRVNILGDVEETVTNVEIDEETFEEIYRQVKRNIPMLFVRGDGVILVAPPLRSAN